MHGDGILVSTWPQCFTVVGVGIDMHALLLAVVNDGDAVGHKDELHGVSKECLVRHDRDNGEKELHGPKTLGIN